MCGHLSVSERGRFEAGRQSGEDIQERNAGDLMLLSIEQVDITK